LYERRNVFLNPGFDQKVSQTETDYLAYFYAAKPERSEEDAGLFSVFCGVDPRPTKDFPN